MGSEKIVLIYFPSHITKQTHNGQTSFSMKAEAVQKCVVKVKEQRRVKLKTKSRFNFSNIV